MFPIIVGNHREADIFGSLINGWCLESYLSCISFKPVKTCRKPVFLIHSCKITQAIISRGSSSFVTREGNLYLAAHGSHNRKPGINNNLAHQSLKIDHFTVVCSVTRPLNRSKVGDDLVLIQTSLVLLCKSGCSYSN